MIMANPGTLISSVRGKVIDIGLDYAVIDCGGVGYSVLATPATLGQLRREDETFLKTVLIVREDAMVLYGFTRDNDRELFRLLQTVNGVGPRLALAVLAVLDPDQFSRAIHDGDTALLTKVPGIGKRVADRLVVELKDKIAVPVASSTLAAENSVQHQLESALVNLGFNEKAAQETAEKVLNDTPLATTSEALRDALAILGANR